MNKAKNELAVKLIKTYQKNKQLVGTGHCKFYPTCSNYAIETYKKFNFFYATLLVIIRLLRCNWFAKRRYYPVKLTKQEKQDQKFLTELKHDLNNDFIDYLLSVDSKVTNGEDLYRYIYDYVMLPQHPVSNVKDGELYSSRFIISNKKIKDSNTTNNDLNKYLNLTKILYNQHLLTHEVHECEIVENKDLFLTPLSALNINDLLEYANIEDGIVIINNCDYDITYRDFKVVEFSGKPKQFKKLYKDQNKLIIKTKNLEIFPYLEYITSSINCFEHFDDVNYFYSFNIKKERL